MMVDSIIELIDDKRLRDRLGAAGRRMVEEKYTWEHNAQAVIDICERFGTK